MTSIPRLSVVIPVYFGERTVEPLVQGIEAATASIGGPIEIILVDDGSPDQSWPAIARLCASRDHVRGVKLSRNFGQHRAISAGLSFAKGELVAVMDCDLQDNPRYLPMLVEKAAEGADVVFARRRSRKHPPLKNLLAWLYSHAFNLAIDDGSPNMTTSVGSYSILSRKAVEAFNQLHDYHRHYLPLVRLLGFRQEFIDVDHEPRKSGGSTYTLKRLIAHGMEGLTAHSVRVLNLSIGAGLVFVLLSVLSAGYYLVGYFRQGALPGFTSVIVVILLSTGMILMSTGILGLYVGRIFEQVKQRPLFIVDQVLN